MDALTLRQKLHSLVETTSEDKLEEIYDLFQQNEYSDDFKAMLDNEYEQYQKDREVVSRDEVNKLIGQLFDSKK
ncbi:MAG TPA: hypothetical protein VN722_07770 [Hanamia sp.]|jgi:hypothetical protein|nr:hypothetical protein [Hanamia sp.]